ncbi:hypothetical protein [Pseudomonas sp. TWI929]|uniref:hypothetical protein n=1 Tax=Pseudomonas sp. TWI929 TaxID=3136795 RepID=UPI00320BB0C5
MAYRFDGVCVEIAAPYSPHFLVIGLCMAVVKLAMRHAASVPGHAFKTLDVRMPELNWLTFRRASHPAHQHLSLGAAFSP